MRSIWLPIRLCDTMGTSSTSGHTEARNRSLGGWN
ncbi:unnamed protein product [Brassica oleracea var. botrytis]